MKPWFKLPISLLIVVFFLAVAPVFASANSTVADSVLIKSSGLTFQSLLRGIIGMLTIFGIAYIFSRNRKAIRWKTVGIGLSIQITLALGVLYVPFVSGFFELVGSGFVNILDFTKAGSQFLFGNLVDISKTGYLFAFQILPTIIFFSAFTSLLFYFGIIQKVVFGLAWAMTKLLRISGAESLSVAGNIFLGQCEAPLLIKPYLDKMNISEFFLVMVGGMATIAGGVMAAYIGFLGGDDPVQRLLFAKHLLAASVMAAPGAVVISKIIIPQTEDILNQVEVSKEKVGHNMLDAIANGTVEGLKLALNVAGMLLVFIAFMAMINFVFQDMIGNYTGLNGWAEHVSNGQFKGFNLQFILGYVMSPIMWLLGVNSADITLVGQILGEKIIVNEFIGYTSLAQLRDAGAFAYEKSIIMSTYILCGFANFSSVGIQIGGIGSLAPGKKQLLSELGMRALLAGTLASALSATIVGMIMG